MIGILSMVAMVALAAVFIVQMLSVSKRGRRYVNQVCAALLLLALGLSLAPQAFAGHSRRGCSGGSCGQAGDGCTGDSCAVQPGDGSANYSAAPAPSGRRKLLHRHR